jgi:hypothetical protein
VLLGSSQLSTVGNCILLLAELRHKYGQFGLVLTGSEQVLFDPLVSAREFQQFDSRLMSVLDNASKTSMQCSAE